MFDTNEPTTRADMIAANDRAMDALQSLIALHAEEDLTALRDAAGWSSTDHLAHLVAWRRSVLLPSRDGITRWEAMGVSEDCFRARQDDAYFTVNEAIRQRHADLPLVAVLADLNAVHRAAQDWMASASDDDLHRPLDPDEPGDDAAFSFFDADFHNHVAAHTRYIARILGDDRFSGAANDEAPHPSTGATAMHEQSEPTTRAELIVENDRAWKEVQALVARHSDADLTTLHDDAGWTSKDHLAHLTAWLRSAVLPARDGISRWEALGVSEAVFAARMEDEWFSINAAIRQQHVGESLDAVMADLQSVVEASRVLIESSSDADLQKPIDPCNPAAGAVTVFQLLNGDGWEHFDLHRGYIAIILGDEGDAA